MVSQMFLVYSLCTNRCSAPSSYAKQLHQKFSSTKQRLQAALTVNPFLIKIPAVLASCYIHHQGKPCIIF
ncbi:hypothetical protein MUK42_15046 [Musa troglodytarum]|nr:hypothetical protein MUK42_15046 [Musa troglodytarum]